MTEAEANFNFNDYAKADYSEITAGVGFLAMLDEVYSAELAEYAAQRPKWVSSVEFRVLAAESFDAIAVRNPKNSAHLIGINFGTVLILHDLAGAVLAHPNLLTDIGDVTCETAFSGYSLARHMNDLTDPANTDQIQVPRFSPINPLRQAYANLLARIALDFIFFHEMTHVIAGHTHCRSAYGFSPTFSANASARILNESDVLRLQALETDADWFATGTLACLSRAGTGLAAGNDWLNLDESQRIRTFCLAALLVFLLCDTSGEHWESCKVLDHPHSLVRQVSMDPILRHHLCDIEGIDEGIVADAYSRAVRDVVGIGHHLNVSVSIAQLEPTTIAAIEDWLERVIGVQHELRDYLISKDFDKRFSS